MFGMLKKLVLLAGIAGVAVLIAKKLGGGNSEEQAWQSYAPKHTATTPMPAAETASVSDDASGATPDEAIADAQAEPHLASTPDAPVEVTEVETQPDVDRL